MPIGSAIPRDLRIGPADLLRRELASRKAINGNYTLRSFARDAGVYPSKMSEILRGKSGISGSRARVIARKLKWDSETADIFHELSISRFSRSPKKRQEAAVSVQQYFRDPKRHLSEMEFRVIADWYHLAAISLAEVLGGRINANSLSHYLKIPRTQAQQALQRLSDLNFLETAGDGFVVKSDSVMVPSVRSSQALRTFHGQLLQKARVALQTQTAEERDNSAVLLTLKKNNLEKAKNLIRDFRKKFLQLMTEGESTDFDSVYCLSLQLFEIAHVNKNPMESK